MGKTKNPEESKAVRNGAIIGGTTGAVGGVGSGIMLSYALDGILKATAALPLSVMDSRSKNPKGADAVVKDIFKKTNHKKILAKGLSIGLPAAVTLGGVGALTGGLIGLGVKKYYESKNKNMSKKASFYIGFEKAASLNIKE